LSGAISLSRASMSPKRIPMSRLARKFWLGSSTSAPLTRRSNLSLGHIAAQAGVLAAVAAATDAEPARVSNVRRETAGMAFLHRLSWLRACNSTCTQLVLRSRLLGATVRPRSAHAGVGLA